MPSNSSILGRTVCLSIVRLMIMWQKQPLKEAGNELVITGLWFPSQYLTLMLTNINRLGDRGREGWQQASKREIAIKHLRSLCLRKKYVCSSHFPQQSSCGLKQRNHTWVLKLLAADRSSQAFASRSETKYGRKKNPGMREVREKTSGGLPRAQCPLYSWVLCAWPPSHLLAKG